MALFGKSAARLWLILLGALAFVLLYGTFAQERLPMSATALYWRALPTIISTHTVNLLPSVQQGPAAPTTTALAPMVISNSISSTIDTTEDYKALGYTDNRKLVRDDDGNLYVAYRKKWNGLYRIFIAKSTDQGNQWKLLNGRKPVERMGNYTQRVPSLAIGRNAKDDANFLHLVWYGNDSVHLGNERQIKYLRLTTAGKLSGDKCCSASFNIPGYDDEMLWQEHPAIYVNGSNVYIVWEGRDALTANAKIKFVRSIDFGRTWSEPLDIAPSDMVNFSRPTLVVTYKMEERQLYVMAYGESDGISQIYWNRSLDNGANWEKWQTVAPTETDQRHVSVARDAEGHLHVVWRELAAATDETFLQYQVFDPTLANGAGDWRTEAETIGAQPGFCLFFPSIAIDENQRVWVAWTESRDCHTVPSDDPITGRIVYRVKSAAGTWGNPRGIAPGDAQLYGSLRSTPAPSGTAMDLVWLDVSHCVSGEASQTPQINQEATDQATGTDCIIHYAKIN